MTAHFRALRFVAACGVFLAVAPPLSASSVEPRYVTTAQVDLGPLLPPPPAPGSVEETADIEAVVKASQTRTAAEAERAHADGKISVLRFGNVLGVGFTAGRLPFALPFFNQVESDIHAIVGAAKVDFDRLRPFIVDQRVAPILNDPGGTKAPRHRSGSYPSGHSTFAYANAILLSAMLPEKAPEIFARAAEFAHNRLVAGVHYPTDIEAGRIAGTVIANALLHDQRFQADFARARTEVRQAVGEE